MKPLILLILDGWGIAPKSEGNAVELANKPVFDFLKKDFPYTQLKAHGRYVGLPNGQVGNSEAGHMNIGAGRVVEQDSVVINKAIKNKTFYKNTAFLETIKHVKENKSDLHFMGLTSENNSPHVWLDHLYSLLELAKQEKVKKVYLHFFTDGRDSFPESAINILEAVKLKLNHLAEVVSILGRFYAMDRGKNWNRTKEAYQTLVSEKCLTFKTAVDGILHSYNKNKTDEFIEPFIIAKDKKEAVKSRIKDNDGIIFFNLRSDRARQLTKCFVQPEFNKKNPGAFKRNKVLKNIRFCAMTNFGPDLDSILTAFPSPDIQDCLPKIINHEQQLYITETEKYAHVTYFINGGFADPVNGEQRLKIDSLKIKNYSTKPEMSVFKITDIVVKCLKQKKYSFYTINFANPDMVGHSGDLVATVKAVEACDLAIKKLIKEVLKQAGTLIITADHGNAEQMLDLKTKEIWTMHTTNPVPFILVDRKFKNVKLKEGVLANIAPTIYQILNIEKTKFIKNKSLIK